MLPDLFEVLRNHFTTHGYWTLAITLLLENAGIPLPGETMLLFASFLAFEHRELNLGLIILVATAACTLGDNLGYWIGFHGGRPLLDRYQKFFRVSDDQIVRGEKMFERFGPVTVFFARFVFGMRVIAGPLAGVLRMQWRRFVLFNFLGATVWVTVISCVGYFFGRHWHRLLRIVGRANAVVFVVAVLVVWFLWRRYRRGNPR
ncbi:MAG TPA: DedA family protein [Terriglobales bacterium]